ncbi:RNA helicase [Priestia aryabhattai]
MKKLVYYIDKGYENYEPFYEYLIPNIEPDEVYARQLCTYLIKDGVQYELSYNEMNETEELLIIKELGENVKVNDEKVYSKGISIEFRKIDRYDDHVYLSSIAVKNHWEAIRYLLKHYIKVENFGLFETSSTELDEDRGCYVIYLKDL